MTPSNGDTNAPESASIVVYMEICGRLLKVHQPKLVHENLIISERLHVLVDSSAGISGATSCLANVAIVSLPQV